MASVPIPGPAGLFWADSGLCLVGHQSAALLGEACSHPTTLIGAIGAVAVFAVCGRISRRPVRLFFWLSLALLLVTLIFPITLLAPSITALNPNSAGARHSPGAVALLVAMHVVAWTVIVIPLTQPGVEPAYAPQRSPERREQRANEVHGPRSP